MNAFVKALIAIAVLGAIMTMISIAIPDTLTTNINNAFVYFLVKVSALGNLFDVAVFFDCIQILANFFLGIAGFVIVWWIGHLFIKS